MTTPDTVADDSDEAIRVSFRVLALDVLSGRPEPQGSAPDLADSYEVWGCRHHPDAVAILRFYDGGRSSAFGAYVPDALAEDGRFEAAVRTLLHTRIPETPAPETAGRLTDLELLSLAPAFEKLGRALAGTQADTGSTLEADLHGTPSRETRLWIDDIAAIDAFEGGDEDEPLFITTSEELLSEPSLYWSGKLEQADAERIEVLAHSADPRIVVLIHFPADPTQADPQVSAYVPPLDDAAQDRRVDEMIDLMEARGFGTGSIRPLPANSPFRRLSAERAVDAVNAALDALEEGEGRMVDFSPDDAEGTDD